LILIGHSNGGAAVIDLARDLHSKQISVDLAITADSVLTLDDNGNVNKVPPNVKLNLNPYVIPVWPTWLLIPFPFGRENRRETDGSLDGVLNIGLAFDEPGAIAHRDAFYDLAGGDERSTRYEYPELLLQATLSVLRGASKEDVFQLAHTNLQILANEERTVIELETTGFKKKLVPEGAAESLQRARLSQSSIEELHQLLDRVEYNRLLAYQKGPTS